MEYLYVIAAFIFVTVIALVLKAKREKAAKALRDKERDLVMEEQIKANAEIEVNRMKQQPKEKKPL